MDSAASLNCHNYGLESGLAEHLHKGSEEGAYNVNVWGSVHLERGYSVRECTLDM